MGGKHATVDRGPPAEPGLPSIAITQGRRVAIRFLHGFHGCAGQPVRGHILQLPHLRCGQSQLIQYCASYPLGEFGRHCFHRRAAFNDGAMEQPLGGGHGHQRGNFAAASRLTEDRHIIGIATEGCDVRAHPLQNGHEVQHSDIGGRCEFISADAREIEIPIYVQAMIVIHHNDVVIARQVFSVVGEQVLAGSIAESLHRASRTLHDRALRLELELISGVQRLIAAGQVFAEDQNRPRGDGDQEPGLVAVSAIPAIHVGVRRVLRRTHAAIFQRVANARPGLRFGRRHKAPAPGGRRAIGDAFEDEDRCRCADSRESCPSSSPPPWRRQRQQPCSSRMAQRSFSGRRAGRLSNPRAICGARSWSRPIPLPGLPCFLRACPGRFDGEA